MACSVYEPIWGIEWTVNELDLESEDWSQRPIGRSPPRLTVGKEGVFVLAGVFNIKGGEFRISQDAGRSWRSLRPPPLVQSVVFRSPRVGYGVVPNSGSLMTGASAELSLWKTLDGGETWDRIGDAPRNATTLYVLPGEDSLLAAST